MLLRHAILLCSLTAAGALTSCRSFDSAWERELRTDSILEKNNQPSAIAGAWQGRWESSVNGHSGALRCLISAPPQGMESMPYEFWYHARWSLFSGTFRSQWPVPPSSGPEVRVTGERDLGRLLGGVFRHKATFTGDRMTASYGSKLDSGTMSMSRVTAE